MKIIGISFIGLIAIILITAINNKNEREEQQVRQAQVSVQQTQAPTIDPQITENEFKADEKEFKKLKAKFRIKEDKFEKVKILFHKTSTPPFNYYVGYKTGQVGGRIIVEYEGDDWIFFNEISIQGSRRVDIKLNRFEIKTDAAGGTVTESIDLTDDKIPLDVFDTNNKVQVRLSGKYIKDYTLNKNQIQALKDSMKMKILLLKHPFKLKL